ncbi:hypothetical protein LCGC14_2801720 [marine sediment metagenome]|uniref:Uncharacterized protein n=1 Tax=marine sediment metagenome TaxID=412755 RepID=A0A0F8YMG4_9ZZZZ
MEGYEWILTFLGLCFVIASLIGEVIIENSNHNITFLYFAIGVLMIIISFILTNEKNTREKVNHTKREIDEIDIVLNIIKIGIISVTIIIIMRAIIFIK